VACPPPISTAADNLDDVTCSVCRSWDSAASSAPPEIEQVGVPCPAGRRDRRIVGTKDSVLPALIPHSPVRTVSLSPGDASSIDQQVTAGHKPGRSTGPASACPVWLQMVLVQL
jgi:hypothetical protein